MLKPGVTVTVYVPVPPLMTLLWEIVTDYILGRVSIVANMP